MGARSILILAGVVLGAPLLAACPQTPASAPKAPVDLAAPGMVAARKTFECAGPANVVALRATGVRHDKQWYEVPPGFTVFGFAVVDLGVTPPPSSRSQTFASVKASPAAVLAAVKAAIPDARVSSPGYPDDQIPANAGFYYISWGERTPGAQNPNQMNLQSDGTEAGIVCHASW